MSHRHRAWCLGRTVCWAPLCPKRGKRSCWRLSGKRRYGYIKNRITEFTVKLFGENGTAWTVLCWLKDDHLNFKDPMRDLHLFIFHFISFIYFLYGRFLSVIHFIHISVYMSIPISQFITPPSPPPLSPLGIPTFVLYTCVSISALQTGLSVPFF